MKRSGLFIPSALVLIILALICSRNAPSRVDAAGPLPPPPPKTVPLYYLYNYSSGYHLFTDDYGVKEIAISDGSYTFIKNACYVFSTQVPGTVLLHQLKQIVLVKSGDGDPVNVPRFLYTTSFDEYNQLKKAGWSNAQGNPKIAIYIAPSPLTGTVALYRLRHPSVYSDDLAYFAPGDYDSYYTTDKNEMNSLTQNGWEFVHVEGWVWPGPTTLAEPPPPAPPESYYIQLLSDLGCNTLEMPGKITCPKQGYFDCDYYRKEGKIKVAACSPNFNLTDFNKAESLLVKLGCKRFLGRPGEYICESWDSGEACDAAIKTSKGLITKCHTPRKLLVLSYQNSFGRKPTDQETSYWSTQLKAKSIDYKDLMQAHRQWLMSQAASAERKALANRSVYEAFGRYPTVEELDNLADLVAKGKNYEELVKGHVDWMLGGTPQSTNELRETIKRAFKACRFNPPTDPDIQEWIALAKVQRLSFKKLIMALKSKWGFPTGAPDLFPPG